MTQAPSAPIALVTGGSRGFGRGIVTALADAGWQVWALARSQASLNELEQAVPGVRTLAGDLNEAGLADRVLAELCPQALILNAGAQPPLGPIQEMSWEAFSQVWETDVKSTLAFGQAAFRSLKPGSQVVVVSSGAALGGSPISGSYAGAKRMQWLMAQYFQVEALRQNRELRFRVLVPKQISAATELGQKAITAYAERLGLSEATYLERFGAPLTPAHVGAAVLQLLNETGEGLAYGLTSTGLELLP